MGAGSVNKEVIEEGQQWFTRSIGVTGLGLTIAAMHRRTVARFVFHAVLLPYTFFIAENQRYLRSFDEVLTICRERNVAVQIIKSIARRRWAISSPTRSAWYQPLDFFFQAEDGIRDHCVTGVQTCALPISRSRVHAPRRRQRRLWAAKSFAAIEKCRGKCRAFARLFPVRALRQRRPR